MFRLRKPVRVILFREATSVAVLTTGFSRSFIISEGIEYRAVSTEISKSRTSVWNVMRASFYSLKLLMDVAFFLLLSFVVVLLFSRALDDRAKAMPN